MTKLHCLSRASAVLAATFFVMLAAPRLALGEDPSRRAFAGGDETVVAKQILSGREGALEIVIEPSSFSDDALQRLAQLAAKTKTTFDVGRTDESSLERLEAVGLLPRISTIELVCTKTCIKPLRKIAEKSMLRRLMLVGVDVEETYIECPSVEPAVAKTLEKLPRFPKLEELVFAGERAVVDALVSGEFLEGVQRISVCTNSEGLLGLAKSKHFKPKELEVASGVERLSPAAVKALVTSKTLKQSLHKLVLRASDSEAEQTLDLAGYEMLTRKNELEALRILDVRWNAAANAKIMTKLVEAKWLEQLVVLDLCRTHASPDIARRLAKRKLPRLEYLCISDAVAGPDDSQQQKAQEILMGSRHADAYFYAF